MAQRVRKPADLEAFALDERAPGPGATETATFGMGCRWGPDARFGAMAGVVRTCVGYAGGTDPDPTYYALGDHTEVVQVEYDPDVLAYEDLLDVFWDSHDWRSTASKRQYRGVVLAHDESQRRAAERSRDAVTERAGQSVATSVESLDHFHLAEDYHLIQRGSPTVYGGRESRKLREANNTQQPGQLPIFL